MRTIICTNEAEERQALITLANEHKALDHAVCVDSKWVGFNCLSFDCPVLETRARLLNLPSFGMDIRKYGSRNVCDVWSDLTFNGECGSPVMSRSQKALAARLGIEVTDDIDGKDVARLVSEGRYDEVAAHCLSDVTVLAEMFTRLYPKRSGLVFDLETVPIDNVKDYREFIKPDSRLTDPKKIEASIQEKAEKAGLDPWLCRIVVIGYQVIV
jgi:predicted PolB exonuclease-like 3'-5' exonuclease